VCLIGKFISHSTQSGFGLPPRNVDKLVPPCGNLERRKPVSLASGVGNNPSPVSSVTTANVGSWYAVPLRIIPESGQVPENVPEAASSELCGIFHDDEAGSNFANEACKLPP
jgi:hypothetical protein